MKEQSETDITRGNLIVTDMRILVETICYPNNIRIHEDSPDLT